MRKALAVIALVAAGLAAVVPARDDDGIAPIDLAERILAREPGLRILHVMDGHDLAVPTAVHADPRTPAAWPLADATNVVVYGIDAAASRAAREAARAAGRDDARHLEGGLAGWVSEVLEPVLPEPVTAADSAANARVAGISRYFGGMPRVAVPLEESSGDAHELVGRAVRRGCGPGF